MKIAVSVPEDVFQAGERVSRRMRISRSQLYTKAVAAYVRQHSDQDVTDQLNRIYAAARTENALDLADASLEVLRREAWE